MPNFKVGDIVRLTPQWANVLRANNKATEDFAPYIGSSFRVISVEGGSGWIRPMRGKPRFWFTFDKLQSDVFMEAIRKAVRDAS